MVPPPEPPANGTASAPGVHDVCLRRKTIRGLKRGQERLDKRMLSMEGKLDSIGSDVSSLVKVQEAVFGGPSHVNDSMALTVNRHERILTQMDAGRSKWRETAIGVGVMLLTLGATKAADHIGSHITPPAVATAASPSPSALPVVASSPSHTMTSPAPWLPAIVLEGDPLPEPSAFASPRP